MFFKGATIQRLFHLTWLTMFETKTPVKERAKIIKCHKQTQTTEQSSKMEKEIKTKQTKERSKH